MAKQIWYPEEGDQVNLTDEKSGYVSSESPISQDEGDWQVEVEEIVDSEGEPLEDEDERTRTEVNVRYDEASRAWVEIS